jgi:hypothetical protein
MARDIAYATIEDYRSSHVNKLTNDDDTAIGRALVAVSRHIDAKLGRFVGFGKDDTAVARLFDTDYWNPLYVPDLVSVTTLEEWNGLAYVATTAYELGPLNASLEGQPYSLIRRTSGVWASRVRVTGIWGWPAVPEAIRAATIELAAILRIESPRATSAINEDQQVLSTSRAGQAIVSGLMGTFTRASVYV